MDASGTASERPLEEERQLRLCTDFEQLTPGIGGGSLPLSDNGIFFGSLNATHLANGFEIRRILPAGQGAYTDNTRKLYIPVMPCTTVELTTWQAAQLELFYAGTSSTTQLSGSVTDARFEAPGGEQITLVILTAVSEFMLLRLCIEA
jgi:hypothetical protein